MYRYIYKFADVYRYIYIYIGKFVYNIYIHTHIRNANFKCVHSSIYEIKNKTHKVYSNYKYLSSFQKLCQCIIKLQTKIQITQQHNKSKFKNTYRIK